MNGVVRFRMQFVYVKTLLVRPMALSYKNWKEREAADNLIDVCNWRTIINLGTSIYGASRFLQNLRLDSEIWLSKKLAIQKYDEPFAKMLLHVSVVRLSSK